MSIFDELAQQTRSLSASVAPSVVSIGSDSRGSGFVVAPGKVVTNAHHLRDRTTSVRFGDGRVEQGRIAGIDPEGDLVVLDVDTGDAPALPWASNEAQAGDIVFGAARDHETVAVTMGQISAVARSFSGPRGRRIRGGVEHTVPLRRGSSGGPLLDALGGVLGVNTHRLRAGFYVARHADEHLQTLLGRLADGISVQRPRLGVAVAPSDVTRRLRRSVGLSEVDGLLVRHVDDASPAAKAGIVLGDVLVSVGGVALTGPESLQEALSGAGEVIIVHVIRGVDELEVTVSFSVAPSDDDEPTTS